MLQYLCFVQGRLRRAAKRCDDLHRSHQPRAVLRQLRRQSSHLQLHERYVYLHLFHHLKQFLLFSFLTLLISVYTSLIQLLMNFKLNKLFLLTICLIKMLLLLAFLCTSMYYKYTSNNETDNQKKNLDYI